MEKVLRFGSVLLGLLLFSSNAHATLFDRGNGLIYDDVNNISWVKDADVSGLNNWSGQVAWAESFSLAGFDDFHLATIEELASLYGQLPGGPNKAGDTSPFEDIQFFYWSGTEFEFDSGLAWFFSFFSGGQSLGIKGDDRYGWAVRPGDSVGDSVRVPEPGAAVLLGLGLIGLRMARRRWGR